MRGPYWIEHVRLRCGGARTRVIGNAALERKLALEVGLVGVAERDATSLDHLHERLDHLGIELRPGHASELDDCSLGADRPAIGVARGHDVVGVGDRDDARPERDFVARKAMRVPVTVDTFVVADDDVRDRAVALDPADELGALLGMQLDDLPLFVGELAVGEQDRVGKMNLPMSWSSAAV